MSLVWSTCHRAANPVDQLLVGHVGEAAREAELLVRGKSGAREAIPDPHVVGEADPAGILDRVAGKADFVGVAVAAHEPVELVADRPRVAVHLEKEVVHGEVEGVDHPVFALVDTPENPSRLRHQQFRGAKVAAHGMGELEFLVVAQPGIAKPGVGGESLRLLFLPMPEPVFRDLFDRGKKRRVKIFRRHSAGDDPVAVEADRKPERLLLSLRHHGHQRAHRAEPEGQIFHEVGIEAFL